MLVVGYGGGVVIDGVPPSVDSVDVIELEPEVIEANRRGYAAFASAIHLADPRVHIVLNDARGALALHGQALRRGRVTAFPSLDSPALSHLYTREFMQQVAAHLNSGRSVHPVDEHQLPDEALLRSLSATLLDVFKELRIYRPTRIRWCSRRLVVPCAQRKTSHARAPRSRPRSPTTRYGIEVPEDLLVAMNVDQQGAVALARGADLITDDRNRLATGYRSLTVAAALCPRRSATSSKATDLLCNAAAAGSTLPDRNSSFPYMARRLAQSSSPPTLPC